MIVICVARGHNVHANSAALVGYRNLSPMSAHRVRKDAVICKVSALQAQL